MATEKKSKAPKKATRKTTKKTTSATKSPKSEPKTPALADRKRDQSQAIEEAREAMQQAYLDVVSARNNLRRARAQDTDTIRIPDVADANERLDRVHRVYVDARTRFMKEKDKGRKLNSGHRV